MVTEAERHHQDLMELRPDYWFRYDGKDTLIATLHSTLHEVAEYISADGDDLVFVDNASDGVNSVLRSIRLPPSSKALIRTQHRLRYG